MIKIFFEDKKSFMDKYGEELSDLFFANKSRLPSEKADISYWEKEFKKGPKTARRRLKAYLDEYASGTEITQFKNKFGSALFTRFNAVKNLLPAQQKSYRYWLNTTKEQLWDVIDEYLPSSYWEKVQKGAEFIKETADWEIYKITNYEASEYYGRGTGWCISGNYPGHENRGRHHFEEYLEDADPHGYFFLIKGGEKYCIFNSLEYNEVQIWQGTNGDDTKIKIIPDHIPDEIVEAYNDYNDSYDTSFELKKLYIPETEDEQREVIYKFLDDHDITRILVHTGFDLEKLVDQYVHEYYSDDDDMLFEINLYKKHLLNGKCFFIFVLFNIFTLINI